MRTFAEVRAFCKVVIVGGSEGSVSLLWKSTNNALIILGGFLEVPNVLLYIGWHSVSRLYPRFYVAFRRQGGQDSVFAPTVPGLL